MRIGQKLILAISLILLLVAIISIVGIRSILKVGKGADVILEESILVDAVQELRLSFEKVLMPANDYLIHGNIDERDNFERLIKKLKERMAVTSECIREREYAIFFAEEEALANVEKGILVVESLARQILSLSAPVGNFEGAKMMEEIDAIADKVTGELNILLDYSKKDANKAMEIANATQSVSIRTTIMIAIIIIFGGLAGGLFFAQGIIKPVEQLVQATKKISTGDLAARAEVSTRDEIGDLANSFNKMAKDLSVSMEKEKELAAAAAAAAGDKRRVAELEKAYKELKKAQEKEKELTETEKKRTSELEKSEAELKRRIQQLETFTKAAVGRELKMKAMEKELADLKKRLGEKE